MKAERVETLVWVCIYGGLFAAMLGIWSGSSGIAAGHVLAVAGGVLIVLGLLLIWLRSRMGAAGRDDEAGRA